MKKIFINDLETEKRNELIKKNKKLLYLLYDDFREMLSFQQEEASYLTMGKNWHNYIEYHDHYTSFFLTVKNWRDFIDNVDPCYLSNDAVKVYNNIKNNITRTADAILNDDYDKIIEEIEKDCNIILKDIEDYLKNFDELPDDDDVIQYADEMEQLNEYYIEEHDNGFCDGVIRRDVSYTETFI